MLEKIAIAVRAKLAAGIADAINPQIVANSYQGDRINKLLKNLGQSSVRLLGNRDLGMARVGADRLKKLFEIHMAQHPEIY